MAIHPLTNRFHSWQKTIAGALAATALLAGVSLDASAQQLPSQYRSVTDVRERIPDEHDRPYFRETQTHRGFEIREPQFTIVAETSAADARWAAAQVSQGWKQAAQLANHFTTVHHQPDFGLSALQVVISNEPLRDRDAPLTTVNVVGIQTQVQINVAPGQPSLTQQIGRLREGAAFAMLHTAGLDSAAPPWVVEGLAAVAGREGLGDDDLKANASVNEAARFGGQQWRYPRATEDTLAYPRMDHEQAAAQMAFLLKGNDAERAPLVFAALGQATTSAGQAAAAGKGFAAFPGDPQNPTAISLDKLLHDQRAKFDEWRENPRAGEPVFEPPAGAPLDLTFAEREMVVLLKLQSRLLASAGTSDKPGAAPAALALTDRGRVRTKIITYDRAKGLATSEPLKQRPASLSYSAFAAYLTSPTTEPWATIDVDGSLLLASNNDRVESLLAAKSQQYSFENSPAGTVLVRRLPNGKSLRGWLADNPTNKSRPLAKFELVDDRRPPKTVEPSKAGPQVTRAPR